MTPDGQVVAFLRPDGSRESGRTIDSKGEAQPEVVAAGDWREPVAERHTALPGVVAPTAATVHAESGRTGTFRIRLRVATVNSVPVLTPLMYVATHVI